MTFPRELEFYKPSHTQDHNPAPSILQNSISKVNRKGNRPTNVQNSCYKAPALHATVDPLGPHSQPRYQITQSNEKLRETEYGGGWGANKDPLATQTTHMKNDYKKNQNKMKVNSSHNQQMALAWVYVELSTAARTWAAVATAQAGPTH